MSDATCPDCHVGGQIYVSPNTPYAIPANVPYSGSTDISQLQDDVGDIKKDVGKLRDRVRKLDGQP